MNSNSIQDSSDSQVMSEYNLDRIDEEASTDVDQENILSPDYTITDIEEPVLAVNSVRNLETNEEIKSDSEVHLNEEPEKIKDEENVIHALSDLQDILSDVSIDGEIILQENNDNDDDLEDTNSK